MKYENVVELTQKAIAQTMGAEYMTQLGNLADLPMSKLVDVGKDITATNNTVDTYTSALLSLLGAFHIDSRKYTGELPQLFVSNMEWGGMVQRVTFDLADVIDDEMWNLVDKKNFSEYEHKFYKPKVMSKLFQEGKKITVPYSIAKEQLFEAFYSWDKMNEFLSGILTVVSNTVELALESYAHMLVCCGIAVSEKATQTSVHLLTEYKAINGESTLTAEDAIHDAGFLRYACQRITNIRNQMKRYTKAFNNGNVPTFTSGANSCLALLSEFDTSVKFNLAANTYNDQLIGVGDFDTVTCWQASKDGAGTSFTFKGDSTVSISADNTNKLGIGTEAVQIPYVIGLAYDKWALSMCLHRSKTTSSYTGSGDFTNHWIHELVNYILDSNYNMVAFILD